MYKLLSNIFDFIGAVGFWFCMIWLDYGDWTILISATVAFILFGVQTLFNNTLLKKV